MLSLLLIAVLAAPDPGLPAPTPTPPDGLDFPPWADLHVDNCKDKLLAAGLTGRHFRFSKDGRIRTRRLSRRDPPIYCHVPQATVMWSGPTGVQYYGYTYTSCAMALAMTRMEQIAQEEARRVWGRPETDNPIRWISHLGTFNCRTQRFKTRQSEHSFGNGLDLASFMIKGWGEVQVKRHWTAHYKSWEKPSEFLRSLSRRLRDEQVFTNVLDPDYDAGHWNHIHVDLAPTSDGLPSRALERAKAMPDIVAGDPHRPPMP